MVQKHTTGAKMHLLRKSAPLVQRCTFAQLHQKRNSGAERGSLVQKRWRKMHLRCTFGAKCTFVPTNVSLENARFQNMCEMHLLHLWWNVLWCEITCLARKCTFCAIMHVWCKGAPLHQKCNAGGGETGYMDGPWGGDRGT